MSADSDDDKFLACARAAGAGVVVSGDSDLLSIGRWEGIEILSPRQLRILAFLTEPEPTGAILRHLELSLTGELRPPGADLELGDDELEELTGVSSLEEIRRKGRHRQRPHRRAPGARPETGDIEELSGPVTSRAAPLCNVIGASYVLENV